MKKFCYVFLAGLLFSSAVEAQEMGMPIIKAEVDKDQIMFQKTIWRRMDLKEKQNKPFFSSNGEITRLLLEGVNQGLLKAYRTDSCLNLMTDEAFLSATSIERQSGGFGGGGFGGGFGDESTSSQPTGAQFDPIPPTVFSALKFKEELIFDRNRSRMYWYIRTVSLVLPGNAGVTYNPAGFEKVEVHFKYDDVVALFRGPFADRAIWYNNQNQAAHRNFGDALELRLFAAPIVQVSNAENLDIRQMVNDPFEVLLLQQKMEYDLMEYESELWEY